ncbi:response regulator [Xylophilus sp. GOD-11R]|uniref:response regulator n=1 Tax=Xylophilus sp. GOD-11R TaxID=3089814 RepID=UPI00298D2F49|nr:response regulator [Xylophilus sp. GOD-11R]WPB59287.1 response regulator [Xylophilus sp. GOD-11R]
MNSSNAPLPAVLLLEPQFVLRRTIVTVAKELDLVAFHEATNIDRALALLGSRKFAGIVIDLGEGPDTVTLLEELRKGAFACGARIPVIVMSSEPGKPDAPTLGPLWPVDVLRKPFKIGALLESVRSMAQHEPGRPH